MYHPLRSFFFSLGPKNGKKWFTNTYVEKLIITGSVIFKEVVILKTWLKCVCFKLTSF